VAIDGRDIARQGDKREKDVYDSTGVRVGAFLVVAVPAVAVAVLVYYIGTWKILGLGGGWVGGVISLVTTAATVAVIWMIQKRRR
jgi:hypothetical protein